MRRLSLHLSSALALVASTARHVLDVIVEWRPSYWFEPLPYKLLGDVPVEIRRDLLAPEPITLTAPTQRATRSQSDQRPHLRSFTRSRVPDFA